MKAALWVLIWILLLTHGGRLLGQSQPVVPTAVAPTVFPHDTLLTSAQERELFEALDLSTLSLVSVQNAMVRGDFSAAQHELAQHFRQRTNVPWKFDPHHLDRSVTHDKIAAEDLLNIDVGNDEGAKSVDPFGIKHGLALHDPVELQDRNVMADVVDIRVTDYE